MTCAPTPEAATNLFPSQIKESPALTYAPPDQQGRMLITLGLCLSTAHTRSVGCVRPAAPCPGFGVKEEDVQQRQRLLLPARDCRGGRAGGPGAGRGGEGVGLRRGVTGGTVSMVGGECFAGPEVDQKA